LAANLNRLEIGKKATWFPWVKPKASGQERAFCGGKTAGIKITLELM
jgi:hypothetical protein